MASTCTSAQLSDAVIAQRPGCASPTQWRREHDQSPCDRRGAEALAKTESRGADERPAGGHRARQSVAPVPLRVACVRFTKDRVHGLGALRDDRTDLLAVDSLCRLGAAMTDDPGNHLHGDAVIRKQ